MSKNLAIVIMGVSGSGKTTIGRLLSEQMQIPFFDGDDFHSKQNIAKMQSGLPLTDEDRMGWLSSLHQLMQREIKNKGCIVACSALKQTYRDLLANGLEKRIQFVHLSGNYDEVYKRHIKRENHFIPTSLLQSQFEMLEVPTNAITISIMQDPAMMVQQIKASLEAKSEIGVVGLGVMGKSLCRNFASKGITISMYNRHVDGKEENIASLFQQSHPELQHAKAFDDLDGFIASLQMPRKILLMVPAGEATSEVIQHLSRSLSKGDMIIDGGNAFYQDTAIRYRQLLEKGIQFIGCGISGGEEGALKGPSLMLGGEKQAFQSIKYLLNTIAAKDLNGDPCCGYIGGAGAGHFVKMVHNGIEYAEMQLLAELYLIVKQEGYTEVDFANMLLQWKKEGLESYLLDITIQILQEKEHGSPLLDQILDVAESKGTGTWATVEIAKEGIPATLIASSLFARHLSFFKALRSKLNQSLLSAIEKKKVSIDLQVLKEAYQLARMINHIQGFWLIQEKSSKENWDIYLSEVARIWTNGCIIRSTLMQELVLKLQSNVILLEQKDVIDFIVEKRTALASIVSASIHNHIAIPCFSDAINFINGISTNLSGANLIQAQRDYFGAHGFHRYDAQDGATFHHQWSSTN